MLREIESSFLSVAAMLNNVSTLQCFFTKSAMLSTGFAEFPKPNDTFLFGPTAGAAFCGRLRATSALTTGRFAKLTSKSFEPEWDVFAFFEPATYKPIEKKTNT